MRKLRLLPLASVLLAAACVTAQDRYEEGRNYETQGRFAEAAYAYLDALQRDANYPGARQRAKEAGELAVDQWLKDAAQLESGSEPVQAAEKFFEIDRLSERARRLGVMLDLGPGYLAERRRVFDSAIDLTVERILQTGDAGRALQLYRTAVQKYRALPEQVVSLKGAAFEVSIRSARAELDAGQFIAAYETARIALETYGADLPLAPEARKIQEEALERGTVHFAATPVWRTRPAGAALPQGFLAELNDTLDDEGWVGPPPFLAPVDPRAVRREMRNLDLTRKVLTPGQAASIGHLVEARRVVVCVLDRFDWRDIGKRIPRKASTSTGGTAEYAIVEGHRVLVARLRFRIVDVESRRVEREGEVEADATRKQRRAIYAGRTGDLVLDGKARADFEPDRLRRIDRELEQEVIRKLADALPPAVYEQLLATLR